MRKLLVNSNSDSRLEHENVHDPLHDEYVAEKMCPRCHGMGDIYDKKLDEDVPCEYCDGMGTVLDAQRSNNNML